MGSEVKSKAVPLDFRLLDSGQRPTDISDQVPELRMGTGTGFRFVAFGPALHWVAQATGDYQECFQRSTLEPFRLPSA